LRPIVLTIAGSDPSGGAGIQADLKAIEANGGYGACAITAITVQNTLGVRRSHVLEPDLVREQMRVVLDDLRVAAVKSGMLGGAPTIEVVADLLRERGPLPYVLDPVVESSNGVRLLDEQAVDALKSRLLPLATVLTANVDDVQALSGREIEGVDAAARAGGELLETGCAAVLVKGGHLRAEAASDVLVTPEGKRVFSHPWIDSPHTHGTGCVYAAAITTRLALGCSLEKAVSGAKEFVASCIRHGVAPGAGRGPVDPMFRLHGGRADRGGEAGGR
jgi:hydroxymethylpyrimidine/phosphomethylpyrimidine kinase